MRETAKVGAVGNTSEFRFFGSEIDRVIQFVQDLEWLVERAPQPIKLNVTGVVKGYPPFTSEALRDRSEIRVSFECLPGAKVDGYIRQLRVQGKLDGSDEDVEVTVGGRNAVKEDLALETVAFFVGIQGDIPLSDTDHMGQKLRVGLVRSTIKAFMCGGPCGRGFPSWMRGFPVNRCEILDDEEYERYLIDHLQKRQNSTPDAGVLENCIKGLACAVHSEREAARLVRLAEDCGDDLSRQHSEVEPSSLAVDLATHYPVLGTRFRKHFSRGVKRIAEALTPEKDFWAKETYWSMLQYVLPEQGVATFVTYDEAMNVWESLWFLPAKTFAEETSGSYQTRLLDKIASLLARYSQLSTRDGERAFISSVLASVFVSLAQCVDVEQSNARKLLELVRQALEKSPDGTLKIAAFAALGQLGGRYGQRVEKSELAGYMGLVSKGLEDEDESVNRGALKILFSFLQKIQGDTEEELSDALKESFARTFGLLKKPSSVGALGARVALEFLRHGAANRDDSTFSECIFCEEEELNGAHTLPMLCFAVISEKHLKSNGVLRGQPGLSNWEIRLQSAMAALNVSREYGEKKGSYLECQQELEKAVREVGKAIEQCPGDNRDCLLKVHWSVKCLRWFAMHVVSSGQFQDGFGDYGMSLLEDSPEGTRPMNSADVGLETGYKQAIHEILQISKKKGQERFSPAGSRSRAMRKAFEGEKGSLQLAQTVVLARPLGLLDLVVGVPWR